MFRVVILLLFTNLFFTLHLSGNISKYINMKYAFLSKSMVVVLFLLTIAEGIRWYLSDKKEQNEQNEHIGCECHHEHNHELKHGKDITKSAKGKKVKRFLSYTFVLIPTLTGVLLPVATLDSQLVNAKGFQFPALEDGKDKYGMHQVLNPDMSQFLGQDAFLNLVRKESKSYKVKDDITLTDDDYLKALEVIYNYSGDFVGKTITFKGFSYNGPNLNNNQIFLLRFGIIHCIADSGAFGMMIQFPNDIHIPNDQWYQVTGTVDTVYYAPMKARVPVLKVTSFKTISKPKDPYVYRNSFN
ncbi:TIGR03943 family protein [Neobacillus sp. MM2021_6]|uniref:TIGR03943 family putative permease subunit n=1 Tax=Bacillaceae TaxID=186817 RepID=UPI00140A4F25|nr:MULTISPECIES: TIGR03943 family protein [Bacillaceae]MBO0961283.1 TIGR03943 family protein [Neobacillus sp. MM2021_6]NHC21513.1 TIGR03943 family protein [Bacillus sp. MM2020_4]